MSPDLVPTKKHLADPTRHHVATRTTQLCNKLPEEVSLDEIERIHIRRAAAAPRTYCKKSEGETACL